MSDVEAIVLFLVLTLLPLYVVYVLWAWAL